MSESNAMYTQPVIMGCIKILRESLAQDEGLYNILVANIENTLKEVSPDTGIHNVAQAVTDRIISGRE